MLDDVVYEPQPEGVEEAWQANWQATADAHQAVLDAFAAWQAAEETMGECPIWRDRRRRFAQPEPCDCHTPQIIEARAAYVAAGEAHAASVERFKAGVTPEQIAAVT